MRLFVCGFVLLMGLSSLAPGQAGKAQITRFRIDADFERYPQKTPQDTLASVLKTIEDKRVDYLLAHLADPDFVDKKIDELSGSSKDEAKLALAFQRLVKATTEHFQEDPTRTKELYRFAKDGEWQTGEKNAVARHKSLATRRVLMKKIQDRWFLEDRDK